MKTASCSSASILHKTSILSNQLIVKHGIYSSAHMKAAGFHYISKHDTVRCNQCQLEVSNWTQDMNPFIIHKQRSPMCPFIQSIIPSQSSDTNEKSAKRLKGETSSSCELMETESLKQVRKRGFSHWPSSFKLAVDQFIDAGFFSCNVGDRVICIYCNKILQTWTPTDDPCEIHKKISPNCPYVTNILMNHRQSPALPVVNNVSDETTTLSNSISCQEVVTTEPKNIRYKELPKRCASFETFPTENLPAVDDFVRAGFFYTGKGTVVTCFYCNGSLQNWGATDNPMIEHARWFSHCGYIRQLCGEELFQQIQQKKELYKLSNQNVTNVFSLDENTLKRYVAARLDLQMSQRMLDSDFSYSIIKRCWEDQLKLKGDDFVNEADLFMACTILKKQIEVIDGRKENILIPKEALNRINNQEKKEKEVMETKPILNDTTNTEKKSDSSSPSNPCALCLSEEKCLAFIPCGHLASCVPCGHSLKSCSICRSEIKASVRIYL